MNVRSLRGAAFVLCGVAAACVVSVAVAQPTAVGGKPKQVKQVAAALKKLPPFARASRLSPPPSRDCPAQAPECLKLPGVVTEEAFLRWVFNDLNGLWGEAFASAGLPFTPPKLRILKGSDKVRLGDGSTWTTATPGAVYLASSKTVIWPFRGVHLLTANLSDDWRDLDFALSIVLAHEYGHHLQNGTNLAGTGPKSHELRADCLAGLWGHTTWSRSILEPEDMKEAVYLIMTVGTPPGLGDDDPLNHGTAMERGEAFGRGLQEGAIGLCLEIG